MSTLRAALERSSDPASPRATAAHAASLPTSCSPGGTPGNTAASDLTDLWAVDAAIAADMLTVFAELRACRSYPDSLGYGRQFQAIVERWRSSSSPAR